MAENSTLDNGAINDLYSTNGMSGNALEFLRGIVILGNITTIFPLVIITFFYLLSKQAYKRFMYCIDPTPTGTVCGQSKPREMRFCRYVERRTVKLLLGVFRTPSVRKEVENKKVTIIVLKRRSLVLGKHALGSAWLFVCISFIFFTYIQKFLADFVLKLTPTCIDKGDFGIPAACYTLNVSYSELIFTSQTSYQVNCTTWNDNLEFLGREIGLLHCFSFYYNVLTSVTQMMGLFGLQTVIVQMTLISLEKCTRCVKRKMCRLRCIVILFILIPLVGSIFIIGVIPLLIANTDPMNKKRHHEVVYQQLLPTTIAVFAMILAMGLILFSVKDDKTTDETHNTRECDGELLKLPTNHNLKPLSRLKGIPSILSMTRGRQRNRVTEERKKEQIDGETDILVTEEGRNTWYDSKDERSSETTQREDVMTVEVHDHTPEKACTSREHEEGVLKGYGHIQMEYMEAVV